MAYSILIVDDSLPMRSVLKRTLDAAGYGHSEFLEADNGQQALEVMKHNWVDLVLTDYNMPVMDGLEFIRAAKKEQLLKDIPFVVVSTEGSEKRINAFMDNGAAAYICKPFTAEDIRDLIINILGEDDHDVGNADSDDDSFDF